MITHKIINNKKLLLPENIECGSKAKHIRAYDVWDFVNCKKCLRKKRS
jgi:hypothetical protein